MRWMNDEIEDMEKTSARVTNRSCVKCKTTKMVSVIFGKSSVIVDWCPQCHGVWLDKGEFEAITAYLRKELGTMHPKDIEKLVVKDIERVWSGGPEFRVQEGLLDARSRQSLPSSIPPSSTIRRCPRLCSDANTIYPVTVGPPIEAGEPWVRPDWTVLTGGIECVQHRWL